jgi:hypothetical protein
MTKRTGVRGRRRSTPKITRRRYLTARRNVRLRARQRHQDENQNPDPIEYFQVPLPLSIAKQVAVKLEPSKANESKCLTRAQWCREVGYIIAGVVKSDVKRQK